MSYGPSVSLEEGRALVEAALDRNRASDFQSIIRQHRSHIPSVTEPTSGLGLVQCCVLSGSIDSGDQVVLSFVLCNCYSKAHGTVLLVFAYSLLPSRPPVLVS